MDIVRKHKNTKNVKAYIWALLIGGLIAGSMIFYNTNNSDYLVDRKSILIGTVKRGELNIRVRGTGVMVPKDIRWIATNVPGRIERIYQNAGAVVKKGDVLFELSNPHLEQQLAEAKWELQALESETRASRVSLESELLDQQIAVMNEKLNFERSALTLNAQKELIDQGFDAISKIDFEEVKMNVRQYEQRWKLEQQRLVKRRENLKAQIEANEARLQMMVRSVAQIEHQVASLTVTATMDSIVQEMPMELGQEVTSGTNLALLARSDLFIAELRIPEKLIKDVVIGQKVSLDTRTSQLQGKVQRIAPTVINSMVQVDVELTDQLPREIRPKLTVDGEIEINTIPNTLFVKRPIFANSFSGSDVYLINGEGVQANKHAVQFGYMSTQYIQVEHGLTEGQQIIVSDASAWAQHNQIRIN
ncbi:HlyD family efflux transporter periplasmic adaptor subunit [Pseudoalteromonas luteoviolacea]|uniref:efflux RND transporter periplasmic adaptor subunit n=1 Tax=Pseudoalteromonas luteoviolacea TaxID=43657 RepID=UPI001B381411|nr:HlyD family efflux transporter periplasmic adaptor subunit [Pseudoalteromonas luteoviolacea]MBQ4811550.1 HlyD family efflux transporter periplasmic adaptor subunit [Pseudoalteromonas luteoviolacea]